MVDVVLADRYRLGEKIASGGMGSVYLATDERLDRKVAVKLLKDELSADPRFVERFRREARAAAALMHPNIAAVYDYGVDGERHFIVMEYVEGRDLAKVLREEGALAPERAATIGRQICSALAHAHKAGVIHRDIKPSNVIIGDAGLVKVTDFGIARAVGDSTLTATGTLLGTAHYISPEQAAGHPAGPASDNYAAGIVTFEMLTGEPPFTGDSPVAIAMRHVSGELPAPSSVNPAVPTTFDGPIARATAKDPGDRFADADAFGSALEVAASRAEAGTTAVLHPSSTDIGTVWPIPGERWNPERIGRIVGIAFLSLVVIATALVPRDAARIHKALAKARAHHSTHASRTSTAPQLVPIPTTLAGEPFETASAQLIAKGLKPKKEDRFNDEIDPGYVIYTDPAPGTAVASGSTVTVFVSSGEEHGPPHEPPGQAKKDHKDKEHD